MRVFGYFRNQATLKYSHNLVDWFPWMIRSHSGQFIPANPHALDASSLPPTSLDDVILTPLSADGQPRFFRIEEHFPP